MLPTCRANIVNIMATDTNVCRLGGVAARHKSQHCQPSSSASTCPLTLAYLYDVQSNGVMSNIDSRLAERNGFVVDLLSPHGMSVCDKDRTNLSEGLDSCQAALNLAGAQPYVKFDLFSRLHVTKNVILE
jgi:hypothetical protein